MSKMINVGSYLWDIIDQDWVTIKSILPGHPYPVGFTNGKRCTSIGGVAGGGIRYFPVKVDPPQYVSSLDIEPGTVVRVWNERDNDNYRYQYRVFSHFNNDGKACCYSDGLNDGNTYQWSNWEAIK